MVLGFLAAAFASCAALADDEVATDDGDQWIPLFDGKSLDGWFIYFGAVKAVPVGQDLESVRLRMPVVMRIG